jgi:hypothetical protein
MSALEAWPWITLLLLGALHGLNPGMGWLFAVALGLQERTGRAVWRALPPLALGHALAIAVAVAIALVVGRIIPLDLLRWAVAAVLFVFGVRRLIRHRHLRYGGMRANARDLTIWSFLMASAHGAGLMILPFAMASGLGAEAPHAGHAMQRAALWSGDSAIGVAITAIHTAGYLAVAGLIAWVVYERVGLRILRTGWINLDLIWAVSLIATALATPLLT